MRKIADATELESELRRLLAYSQSELPSRSRVASELQKLSHRLQPEKTAKLVPRATGTGASKEDFIAALNVAANNIYDCRGETRPIYQALQDAKEAYMLGVGAIGRHSDAIYNRTVEARDAWNELDRLMGRVANHFEIIARDLKREKPENV